MTHTMPLLVAVGGYLGAGKTTTIQHTAGSLRAEGRRVAIVTNDQSSELVDTEVARRAGDVAVEIPDGCFCCRFDALEETLAALVHRDPPDVILAEAVGSCTDLAATVYQPLRQLRSGIVALGPLTVVADGTLLRDTIGGARRLPAAIAYLHERQLAEADIILLNKVDLLTAADRERVTDHLAATYPGVTILPVSAATGAGLDGWTARLAPSDRAGDRVLDIDYDRYAEAEALLGWVNLTGSTLMPDPESGRRWLRMMLEHLRAVARADGSGVAHVKAWIDTEGGTLRGHLVDTDAPPRLDQQGTPDGEARLLVNARAPVSPDLLREWVETAMRLADDAFGIQTAIAMGTAFRPARPVPLHRLLPLTRPGD